MLIRDATKKQADVADKAVTKMIADAYTVNMLIKIDLYDALNK